MPTSKELRSMADARARVELNAARRTETFDCIMEMREGHKQGPHMVLHEVPGDTFLCLTDRLSWSTVVGPNGEDIETTIFKGGHPSLAKF